MASTRIPKKVRDEAILICAIAASTPDYSQNYDSVSDEIDPALGSLDLALAAWSHVVDHIYAQEAHLVDDEIDAEAHALLQTGWSPS